MVLAVCLMLGNILSSLPSAEYNLIMLTPGDERMVKANTMIPTPPNHCMNPLQKSIVKAAASKLEYIVKPVVV